MRFCKNCEKELNGDYEFCPFCGTKVEKVKELPSNPDVDRINALIPVLKTMLGSGEQEKAELKEIITQQQKMLDDTVKELAELKETIKQNSLALTNGYNAPYPYGPMMPYPQYAPTYVYPNYVPSAYAQPPYPAQGSPYPQPAPEPAPERNNGSFEKEQVQTNESVDIFEDNLVVKEEQNVVVVTPEAEDVPVEQKKSRLSVRILSFIMMILSLGAVAGAFVLAYVDIKSSGVSFNFNGVDVVDAIIYNLSGGAVGGESVLSAFTSLGILVQPDITYHIAWWAFATGFMLSSILLVLDAIIGFGRIASGNTKGRFYFLPFLALVFTAIGIPGLSMFMSASGELLDILGLGAMISAGAIVLRIILSFFVRNTKKESDKYVNKKARKEAKKAAKREAKLERLAR